MIEIIVTGKPIAKGRGRVGLLPNGRSTVFTPSNTRKWENDARQVARNQMRGQAPLQGPLMLRVYIAFPIPASWPTWKKQLALQGEIQHTTKPDSDNVLKAAKDAMNGIVWIDDCQVVRTHIEKYYSEIPHVTIQATSTGMYPTQITKKPTHQPRNEGDQRAVSTTTPAASTRDHASDTSPREGTDRALHDTEQYFNLAPQTLEDL